MTVKDLAKRTKEMGLGKNKEGINYNYLSELMSGNPRSIPTTVKVGQIAAALGVEPWQIADGLEPLPEVPMAFREASAQYGNHYMQTFNVYQIAMAKIKKANLNEGEVERLSETVTKIVDLLTIEDQKERDRYAAAIYGIIDLCESVLSQQGGRDKEGSFPSEQSKKEVL